MLYAFNASPSAFSQAPVWSIPLATHLIFNTYDGQYINCQTINTNANVFPACDAKDQNTGETNPFYNFGIGITGTPVIDMSATPPVLYVVAAVCFDSMVPCQTASTVAGYYLFAVDITTPKVLAATFQQQTGGGISGTVSGQAPAKICQSTYPATGRPTISFDNGHLQRSALLLLNVEGTNTVYVAFADLPENDHGWMFGYQLNSSGLQQVVKWASTPYGTGGGIWGSGAGPASDGTWIYVATGNGTFDANNGGPDYGDSLLQLSPSNLAVNSYYTPYDVFTFPPERPNGYGLCPNDEDLASGGVLLPPGFTYDGYGVVVNADKQSNVYVASVNGLGGFSQNDVCGQGTYNNIQCVTTPPIPSNDSTQGYWASPAYWFDGTNYWLYYAATMAAGMAGKGNPGVSPEALNAYQLQQTGPPVSQTPFANSGTSNGYPILFCDFAPTPSVSSEGNTAGSGIVWAIEENQNSDNNGGHRPPDCAGSNPQVGALHAFCAAKITASGTPCPSALYELYSSRPGFKKATIGPVHGFPTPTIFQGQVYMGTDTEVDVFGLCNTLAKGCIQ